MKARKSNRRKTPLPWGPIALAVVLTLALPALMLCVLIGGALYVVFRKKS